MIRGRGPHEAAAHNYRQKIETRRDVALDEVEDVAAEAIDAGFAGELSLTKEERKVGLRHLRSTTKDEAVSLTQHYHLRVAPHVQPVLVEERILVKPDPKVFPRPLLGILDLKDLAGNLRDMKTKYAAMPEGEEHVDQQLTYYVMLDQARTGRLPEGVGFDVLVMKKGGDPSYEYRPSKRDRVDVLEMLDRLRAVDAAITSGAFPPTDPTNVRVCSERWCGFWRVCPFVRGGRRRV